MLYRSQIVLSKMFTTPRMYNYSANSIPSSEWCGALVHLKSAMVRVRCGCAVTSAKDPFTRSRSSLRILGKIIPHMWLIIVHENLCSKETIYRVVLFLTSSSANAIMCFHGYHCHNNFIGPSKLILLACLSYSQRDVISLLTLEHT